MHHDLSHTAALFSDPRRASILISLLGGVALPAGQLAIIANVAPQTASSHLSQLVAGRLLTLEQQGRHRYYRLASAEVADVIEALMALAPRHGGIARQATHPGVPDAIVYARTCYAHLAGRLAVQIAEALEQNNFLTPGKSKLYVLNEEGRRWFQEFGIVISNSQNRNGRFARQCLDWTERRHHISGQLGSAMLERFLKLRWIARAAQSRAVRVTLEGRRGFRQVLNIDC